MKMLLLYKYLEYKRGSLIIQRTGWNSDSCLNKTKGLRQLLSLFTNSPDLKSGPAAIGHIDPSVFKRLNRRKNLFAKPRVGQYESVHCHVAEDGDEGNDADYKQSWRELGILD